MPNLVSPLTAEIQAQYPGASIKARGYDHLHYDLQNGQFAFVQVLGGLHYWDGADWQELNTDFGNSNRQGYQDNNGTAQFLADVDSNTGRYIVPRRDTAGEYFTLGRPQYWTGSQWRNLNMPGRVRSGHQLTWDSTAIAFSIQHSGHGIKYTVTLKTNAYATNVRWAYTLVGLHWNTAAGHEWELISNTSGKVVTVFRVPTLTDSSSIDNPVVRPVAANHDGGYITFTPDYSGLVYPVYVDPTFTDGYGGDVTTAADDGMYSVSANNNYGISTTGWTLTTTKGLTRFNLSSLTNVASVVSATLSLFHAAKSTNSAWTLTVYSVASGNSTWIEGTKDNATAGTGEPCWSYKAYNTVAWAGSAGLSTADTDYESSAMGTVSGNRSDNVGTQYDVALNTTRVKGWCGASNTNYGLLSTISAASGGLCTSDHATTGYRPKLVVVWAGNTFNLTASAALASATIDTPVLRRTMALAGNAALASNTVDTPVLKRTLALAGAAALASNTLDTAVLARLMAEVAAASLSTATPDATLTLAGGNTYDLLASALLASNTLDTAVLRRTMGLSASASAATATNDIAVLARLLALAGSSALASATPESVVLRRLLAHAAAASLASVAPDNAVLALVGLIELAASALAGSTTPEIAILRRLLAQAAAAQLLSTTPTAALQIAYATPSRRTEYAPRETRTASQGDGRGQAAPSETRVERVPRTSRTISISPEPRGEAIDHG